MGLFDVLVRLLCMCHGGTSRKLYVLGGTPRELQQMTESPTTRPNHAPVKGWISPLDLWVASTSRSDHACQCCNHPSHQHHPRFGTCHIAGRPFVCDMH